MKPPLTKIAWRSTSPDLIDLGKELARIEGVLREIPAAAVVDDELLVARLQEAISASRRLTRNLGALLYEARQGLGK